MNFNSGGPVRVVLENPTSPWIRLLKWIGGVTFFGFLTLSIVSLALESSGAMKIANQNGNVTPVAQKPKVTFDDVQGCPEAKEDLKEVVDFLKHPEQFTELGGRLPKGVLLTGPPGTGKTLLARAVAGEAGVSFFFMSGSEFDELYVGVGARRVRDLFAAARSHSPAIVFIDEIDAIGGKRGQREQAHIKQTLNQLLVELDGFSPTEGVIFIGATNFPELLDQALVRPGRFDRNVHVPLPDVRGRLAILNLHTKKVPLDTEVDLSYIARGTPGFSGADLHNLVNHAAIQASREGARSVTMRNLEFAKDKIMMGAERKSAVISESERKITAFHEGGHALVAYHTPGSMPLHKATIIPRGQSLGMVMQLPEMDRSHQTRQQYEAQIAICMGGRAAEELIFGHDHITSGASSDIQSATRYARAMVTLYGMSDKVGLIAYRPEDAKEVSAETKQVIESEVKRLIDTGYGWANKVLVDHRDQLDRLANALLEHETLTQKQIIAVIEGQTLPPPTLPPLPDTKDDQNTPTLVPAAASSTSATLPPTAAPSKPTPA
ncbi:peptidase family M41-domain-containing protein [Dimargaris cristalligena]|uniref:Peptidase family M41-domain-containing protein n=1 Tax=Dimargaris cristalligena TaxID=215637 RepID=A0A4P9ZPH2_9FUNG|nr:peptidase family M41-domain-containing protein [Dimargaris cristalligena]|eukprot:RKP35207.1 peptidase family M41-domain-containing protein [Dimargaris cristalligena]